MRSGLYLHANLFICHVNQGNLWGQHRASMPGSGHGNHDYNSKADQSNESMTQHNQKYDTVRHAPDTFFPGIHPSCRSPKKRKNVKTVKNSLPLNRAGLIGNNKATSEKCGLVLIIRPLARLVPMESPPRQDLQALENGTNPFTRIHGIHRQAKYPEFLSRWFDCFSSHSFCHPHGRPSCNRE